MFSKNRALQLDATLKSLIAHCKDFEMMNLAIIYSTTDSTHNRQYQRLTSDFSNYENIHFIKEKNFRQDLNYLLMEHGELQGLLRMILVLAPFSKPFARLFESSFKKIKGKYVLFLVDDSIFVKSFTLAACIKALMSNPKALGFSLRLGKNTSYCYPKDATQRLPAFTVLFNAVMAFDWTKAELDFTYPLEVSSSIYRIGEISHLLTLFSFANPNQLEGEMAKRQNLYKAKLPRLLCFEQSVAFSNPANKVYLRGNNRYDISGMATVEHLSKAFDDGFRVDIKAFKDFVPGGCHHEVKLPLVKAESSD